MKNKQATRVTVQFDSEADAAYVRFARGKVAKTLVREDKDTIITFDVDSQGHLLGAEVIGARDFTFDTLMAKLTKLREAQTRKPAAELQKT
jgi:uncharacterized protein YuzE